MIAAFAHIVLLQVVSPFARGRICTGLPSVGRRDVRAQLCEAGR